MKTRDRILEAALELFNQHGEKNITTAQIAQSLGISEGNLWYHFRTKQELILQLFERLEQRITDSLSDAPPEHPTVEHFVNYVVRSGEIMWDYRFLFRESLDITDAGFSRRVRTMQERGQGSMKKLLMKLVQRGLLRASEHEIELLIVNVWIVHRYWLEYLQSRSVKQRVTPKDVKAGLLQVLALFLPYLRPADKKTAEELIKTMQMAARR